MNEGQSRGSWLSCLDGSTNLAKNWYELLRARNTLSRDFWLLVSRQLVSESRDFISRAELQSRAQTSSYPSIAFYNSDYFDAQPPKFLLRSSQTWYNTWCSLDSMSTGPSISEGYWCRWSSTSTAPRYCNTVHGIQDD